MVTGHGRRNNGWDCVRIHGIDYRYYRLPANVAAGVKSWRRNTSSNYFRDSARWRDGAARRHADALAHQRTAFAGDDGWWLRTAADQRRRFAQNV